MLCPYLAPLDRAHDLAEPRVAISLACPADNPANAGLAVFRDPGCGAFHFSFDATVQPEVDDIKVRSQPRRCQGVGPRFEVVLVRWTVRGQTKGVLRLVLSP